MPVRTYTANTAEPREPIVIVWPDFSEMFYRSHKQGEHIAIVGANGTGKTVMGLELCKIIGSRMASDRRPARVTVIQTKERDDTLRAILPKEEWPIIPKWPPGYGEEHCIVWPRGGAPSGRAKRQQAVLAPLLDTIYMEGNQTVYIPEAAYFERALPYGLGLGGLMEQWWSTARSLKLTAISDTQRPRQVTRLMWTEPQWLFIFTLEDDEDIKRVAQLSGGFQPEVWECVPKLGEHECLVIRRQKHNGQREIYVTRVGE